MRVIYTKDKWSKCNPINKALLNDYMVELRSKRKSSRTIDQYYNDGRMVICYVHDEMDNKTLTELKKPEWRSILLWLLEEREVSNARCNRIMSMMRGMMEFAEDEDDYDYENNIVRKIKGLQKEPVREIFFLEDEQIDRLRIRLIEKKKYKLCCYLDMMYDSAARRNELFQVEKDGLLERNFTNKVQLKGGGKARLIYHSRTKESLSLYLADRGTDDIPQLWIKGTNEKMPVEYSALYDWCKALAKELAAIDGKYINFTPHSFRHSALENYKNGTHYMCKAMGREEGFTIEEIQTLAHHKSSDTTKGYLKPQDNNILSKMFGIDIE